MKKLVLALAVVAAALCACTKAENPTGNEGRKAVKFTVENLGTYTLKSETLALGAVGCGTVGIYASSLGANNVEATVSGEALSPSSTIYWGIGQTVASTFVARYPYFNGAEISGEYAIPADQTSLDNYSYHANVMNAVTSASPDPGTVAFQFYHPFAKVVVNITNNLGADEVSSVVMKQVKLSASTFDISTVPATITLTNDKSNATAYRSSANSYSLIIMPQAATNEMDIVVTTVLGSTYTFRITGEYTFVAGKTATAEVTLNPSDGGASNRVAIGSISFHANDWIAGDDTTIGTIGSEVGNYWTIFGNVYSTADKDNKPAVWTKKYNMVYTAENTWTLPINYDDSMSNGDASSEGFKFNLGDTYYGTSSATAVDSGAELSSPGTYNIKLASSGKYTITFNSSTHVLTYTRTGDAE